ncbi:MAG: hypothetical protein Kilf2KO_01850 [Rhodospirillales bacterium]
MDLKREGSPEDCHSLWIGERLPPLAQVCLKSFLRQGHRVLLHCFDPVAAVPEGVETRDAARILPRSAIVRNFRSKSPSLFSNYFRYKMMESLRGYWIDCDLYCVRPFDYPEDPVFGWQHDGMINGAVLRLEPGTPMHRDTLKIFEDRRPDLPWISRNQVRRARLRSLIYRKPMLSFAPWGVAGPNAITWLAKKHGEAEKAQTHTAFYPLDHESTRFLRSADFDLASVVTPETRAVHLWNELLYREEKPLEAGSFLDRLQQEAAGGPPALTVAA